MNESSKIRVCELDDCDNVIDQLSNPKKRFCCESHGSLYRVRKKRLKDKENKTGEPYIITGIRCPVDGKVFPVKLFKNRGRPKKYDCSECREIARQIRLMYKEEMNISDP